MIRIKKSHYSSIGGYDNCQILLKNLTSILSSFGIKRTKDFNKITFKNNFFIQPYNSEYHIKIEKIII